MRECPPALWTAPDLASALGLEATADRVRPSVQAQDCRFSFNVAISLDRRFSVAFVRERSPPNPVAYLRSRLLRAVAVGKTVESLLRAKSCRGARLPAASGLAPGSAGWARWAISRRCGGYSVAV